MAHGGNHANVDKNKRQIARDSKVNLAALLNDPRKARRDYDVFTKTWGESFKDLTHGSTVPKSSRLPEISEAHFANYLSKTRDKFLRHQSQHVESGIVTNEGNEYGGSKVNAGKASLKTASLQQQLKIQAATKLALDSIPRMFLRPTFSLEDPGTFSSVISLNSLSSGHATTRNYVSDFIAHGMSSSKLLQEKLSHHLDLVEVAIVRQISVQSDAFFDAMASHEDLNEFLRKMLSSVHQLKLKISAIGETITKKSFKVLHCHCKHRNRVIVLNKLQTMITVHQAQPTIQLLLSTGEYAGALDLIETTQEVLKQELAGLHCFRHLSSQLSEIENVIGHMMNEEFSNCITNDLQRPLIEGSVTSQPHHLTAIALGLIRRKRLVFLDEFREEVKTTVKTIIKTTVMDVVEASEKNNKNLTNGVEQNGDSPEKTESLAERMRLLEYNEWIELFIAITDNLTIFLRRVKSFLTVVVNAICLSTPPSKRFNVNNSLANGISTDSDLAVHTAPDKLNELEQQTTSPKDTISTDNVWDDMDQYEAQLMESVNENPREKESKQKLQRTFSQNISDSISTKGTDNSDSDSVTEECDSSAAGSLLNEKEHSDFMQSICENLIWAADFAHDRCVKVIIAKNKNSSLEKLTSLQFLTLAQSIEKYLTDTENIFLGEESNGDKDSLYFDGYFMMCCGNYNRGGGVLRGVLQSQASRFVTRFHEERRNKLSLILDNETWKQSEVPAQLAKSLQNLSVAASKNEIKVDKLPDDGSAESTKPTALLTIDGDEYAVVGTVLMLLKMVTEYLKCADDLPASTQDLMTRVCELLTLFNSRTCQLVLGAGALQLAGLKTITTRNLGLASRCLQLVLNLLPSIRYQFKQKLSLSCPPNSKSKHLSSLKHFDHVSKDYKDHITEIDNKLVNIMDSAIENNLSRWQVKAPMPSREFRTICRQMTKLHEMIADLLPEKQVENILYNIHLSFAKQLHRKLQQYGVRNDGGPQCGLVMSDIAFYEVSLKNLKVFNEDLSMNSVWS
ncbi:vacuolar protein sorting-associated protein 54-like [Styela clava]